MPRRLPAAVAISILATYVIVAIAQTWPLSAGVSSQLTADPAGDGGVYIWNTWAFRHELVDRHRLPFSTDAILTLDPPTDLSLHNYTVFPDLIALPLQPRLGIVAAFNIAYLLQPPLIGFGMFLLARRVGAGRIGVGEAWLAGLFFTWSPFLVARSTGHYSLAAAAPLPFFAWCLHRTLAERRGRDALATGACVAWAFWCDPYFAVYCLLIGAAMVADVCVEFSSAGPGSTRARSLVNGAILLVVLLAATIAVTGGTAMTIGGTHVSVGSLYTPMLVLGLLLAIRVWLHFRPRAHWRDGSAHLWPLAVRIGIAAVVPLAPTLHARIASVFAGHVVTVPVPWRSSAPGVDLLSFLLPNPNHPLAPAALVDWLGSQPGGYIENVASLSWIVLGVVTAAAWTRRAHLPRVWSAIAIGAGLCASGPFLRIGGLDTHLPTPWTFLRYVPIIGEARMPGRIAVVVTMAVAVLFASALAAWVSHAPRHRRAILTIVGVLLVAELWTAPRPLYSAALPRIVDVIAEDERPVSVLDLPFGLKDGHGDLGVFEAAAMWRQTRHGKRLVGGYLSRIPEATRDVYRANPFTSALLSMSEGVTLRPEAVHAADREAAAFMARVNLGYVVMNDARVPDALREFATRSLRLRRVMSADGYTLYVPTSPTDGGPRAGPQRPETLGAKPLEQVGLAATAAVGRLAVTSEVLAPSATYFASVPPHPSHSSSGYATTAISRSTPVTAIKDR